jgi:CPA2 family monovalent cation:H+ antiporter-2
VNWLFSGYLVLLMGVPVIVVVLYIFSQRIQKFYNRIEGRFITNLNARETKLANDNQLENSIRDKNTGMQPVLDPWDAHIVDMEVDPQAEYVGKTLLELGWREQFGINVVYIKRGDKMIHAPGRNNKLMPFDHAGIIATDAQMQQFKPVFDSREEISQAYVNMDDVVLEKIVVDEHTRLKGLTIRDSGVREKTNGLVVGIERKGERILNPESTLVFEWDDIVWIVGERRKIQRLSKPRKEESEKKPQKEA